MRLEENTDKFKHTLDQIKKRSKKILGQDNLDQVAKSAESLIKVKKVQLALAYKPDTDKDPIDFSKSSCVLGF